MIVTLRTERLRTIEQLEAFVEGSASADCKPLDRESAYDFPRRTLVAFDYHRLGKADRGCVRRYVVKVTAMSPAQLTQLVARHAETGAVADLRARNSGRPFETRYRPVDIRLLADVDEAFGQMSGLATCEILRRAFEMHGTRASSGWRASPGRTSTTCAGHAPTAPSARRGRRPCPTLRVEVHLQGPRLVAASH